MSDTDARTAHLLLTHEVADFLYREAELLDERRYDEWLALLADDLRYWMPMRRNVKFGEEAREFTREAQDIAWFDEGKDTLTRRVRQIQTGIHWAEEPVSRISHLVTNVQLVEATPSAAEAREVGAPVQLGVLASEMYKQAQAHGWGQEGFPIVARVLEAVVGVELRK